MGDDKDLQMRAEAAEAMLAAEQAKTEALLDRIEELEAAVRKLDGDSSPILGESPKTASVGSKLRTKAEQDRLYYEKTSAKHRGMTEYTQDLLGGGLSSEDLMRLLEIMPPIKGFDLARESYEQAADRLRRGDSASNFEIAIQERLESCEKFLTFKLPTVRLKKGDTFNMPVDVRRVMSTRTAGEVQRLMYDMARIVYREMLERNGADHEVDALGADIARVLMRADLRISDHIQRMVR